MTVDDLVKKLQFSSDKTKDVTIEISATKLEDIASLHFYLNGEIVISTKPRKKAASSGP